MTKKIRIQKRIHSNCAINQQQSCILFMKIGFDEIYQYALRSPAHLRDRTTSLANHRKAIFRGNKRPDRIMIEAATQSIPSLEKLGEKRGKPPLLS